MEDNTQRFSNGFMQDLIRLMEYSKNNNGQNVVVNFGELLINDEDNSKYDLIVEFKFMADKSEKEPPIIEDTIENK